MKVRKKPVVVDAVRWDGDVEKLVELMGVVTLNFGRVVIYTPEGAMYANAGDWIIKGVKGEFYPCKPDIFEATYERVEE